MTRSISRLKAMEMGVRMRQVGRYNKLAYSVFNRV